MKTIAIFGEKNKGKFVKDLRKILNLLQLDFEIITEENISAIKYFDYIILLPNSIIHKASFNCGFCFIDMDQNQDNNIDIYGNIITYGFGSKNTVTISSVENENTGFVYCLQRYLNINALRMLEPQEMPVNVEFLNEIELYIYMVCITIALIEGMESLEINDKVNSLVYSEKL